jgi:hypothetical protein
LPGPGVRGRAFVALLVATVLLGSGGAGRTAEPGPAAAGAASAAPTHRPLRENQPAAMPEPTAPETFAGYAGASPLTVVPRKAQLALFPCSQCHKAMPLNPQPRKLVNAPHPAALQHGKGRLWCLDCHLGNDRDALHSVGGAKIDFDQSYLLCGQCHSARHRDWTFGAHGKRVAGWTGERQIYSCTHCHDPHDPLIQGRAPSKPPAVRAGLTPMNRVPEHAPLPWQRNALGQEDGHAARP